MTSIETPDTFVHYGYNDANRVISEEQGLLGYPVHRIEKAPDADGNPTQLVVTTNGAVEFAVYYDYTLRNQLAHITQADSSPLYSYTYDAAGNMTRRHGEIIGDSTNAPSAYYDELNRPTYWEQTRGGDVGFSGSHYQYDHVGREVAVWRDEDGNKGERYWFNAADHLTRAVYKADNVSTASPSNWNRFRDYNYTPDLLNWTSVNDNGYVAPLTHNDLNQYTGINGFVPQYDGNFNQTTTIYGPSFVYNAQNQVVGGSMQCTYDGLGRCVKRTIGNNTIVFAYDGWKPVAEYDGGGNLHARNIYGPGPDEVLMRGDSIYGWFFYHADKQGSVTALVAGDGTVVEKYSYDAFGRPTVTDWWDNPHYDGSGNLASWYGNRFMFTGREWLSALQLYDYRHRLYNPDNGRFLQSDPTGFDAGDMNLFRYCDDDPVDRSDPMGLDFTPAGEARLVHDLKDRDGLVLGGLTGPYAVTIALGVGKEADGTFSIKVTRFDVKVEDKQVAKTINGRTRSAEEINASKRHEDLHEAKARLEHNANQNKVLRTGLATRAEAEGQQAKEKRALFDRFTRNREQEQRDCKKGVGEWKPIRREEYKNK